jgi:ribosome biogenesis protein Nip4
LTISENELVTLGKSVFRIDPLQKRFLDQNDSYATYAGEFLGTVRKEFSPSQLFIEKYLKDAEYQITLPKKESWLFVCGRDVFHSALPKDIHLKANRHIVVKDNYGDVIGYGLIPVDTKNIAIKNIIDRGELLRREKR